MKADVFNMKGEKVKTVELPAEIFEAEVNVGLMHQAYVQQIANARLGTHKTKTRSEVSGGGKKPWKQKGTGRARQGSTRAPQWVHGGKIHTPRPRKYTQHMPLKMRRAALRAALSAKAKDAGLVIVDELVLAEPKTRLMAQSLKALVGEATALVLAAEKDADYDVIARSTGNLSDAKLLMANYLNIRDLLNYDKLVMPLKALDVLKAQLV
ncbi:MAG: 50S ribosomal protein L4 [Chloroflexota bacterium]